MSDERTVNVPLLRKAVEWAEAEAAKPVAESAWDQSWYVTEERPCGTAYCIAGWVNVQQGATTYSDIANSYTAAQTLGIPKWDGVSGHLFDGANTIEDVRRIAEDLAGERL